MIACDVNLEAISILLEVPVCSELREAVRPLRARSELRRTLEDKRAQVSRLLAGTSRKK